MTDSSASETRTSSSDKENFILPEDDDSDPFSGYEYNTFTDNALFRKMTVQIADQSALHCKNGCGFYGNREWDGYCSICYKDIRHGGSVPAAHSLSSSPVDSPVMKTQTAPPPSPLSFPKKLLPEVLNRAQSASSLQQSSSSSSFLSNPTGSLSFRKFEEKKRQQSDKKSIKSIFKRATFREYRSSSSHATGGGGDTNSWQFFSLEKPLMFGEEVLAKLFRDAIVHDINSNVNKCVDKVNKLLNRGASIEELTECIHDFYSLMNNRFQTSPQYKDITNVQFEQLVDQTEKILMDKVYLNLFARVQSEEEERDLELQKKIRNLNWIMSNHLDVDINLRNPKVKDLMDKAITEIIELDSKQVSLEKLESVVKCSKTIFQMLQINSADAISADQFLPALVFVIIQANPPLLQSNIKFITRFSTPSRLMTGEAGYYFTNLCCATTFIEKISGESLNMSESDFESYMNGEAQPPGYYKQSFLCEPFRILNSTFALVGETSERSAQCKANIDELESRLDHFSDLLESRYQSTISSSQTLIDRHSTYQLFEKDFDPTLLPDYFRSLYLESRRKVKQTVNSVLIDLGGDESSSVVGSESNYVCDSLSAEPEVTLPPPLAPEVVSGTASPQPETTTSQ